MSRRRLIIGLGVCGRALLSHWRQAGDAVCGISRRDRPDLPQVTGDATDDAVLAEAARQLGGPPETVVLCAGPGLRTGGDNALDAVAAAVHARWPTAWFAYTGSTGVYADLDGAVVDEHGELSEAPRPRRLRAIEQAVAVQERHLILRVGALAGPERQSMRERLRARPCRVRGPLTRSFPFCHDQNLVTVVTQAAAAGLTGLYNCVAPQELSAEDYYRLLAADAGLPPPVFEASGAPMPDRRIDARALYAAMPEVSWHDPIGRLIDA